MGLHMTDRTLFSDQGVPTEQSDCDRGFDGSPEAAPTAPPFVDFAAVDDRTDLFNLNLDWRESDLPEHERTRHVHKLHPYQGKFVPQIPELFLRKFSPSLVYDPFCGSGTTLVEAKTLGIPSFGVDISLFNILLCDVKTAEYDIDRLGVEVNDLLFRFGNAVDTCSLFASEAGSRVPQSDSAYLRTWFAETALSELLAFREMVKDSPYSDLFKIVLTRSARSARLVAHSHLGRPRHPQTTPYECRKHGQICYPVESAAPFIYRYALDSLHRLTAYQSIASDTPATVVHGDARTVDLPDGIDLVITSPPYLGVLNYHQQHRYAYELLGLEMSEDEEIGSSRNGSSRKARKQYLDGINSVFSHTRDAMADKGRMVIVVNDEAAPYDPADSGFRQLGKIKRQVGRRAEMSADAYSESVLVWEKS